MILFHGNFMYILTGSTKPEVAPLHFPSELKFGKRAALYCSVLDGDPPFTFVWLKDGVILTENDNFFIAKTDGFNSVLSISKLGAESNGNYSCRVKNAFGSDEKFSFLQVKGNNSYSSLFH